MGCSPIAVHDFYVGCIPCMQLGLWSEKERGKKKGLANEASQARDWRREGAAEPGDRKGKELYLSV